MKQKNLNLRPCGPSPGLNSVGAPPDYNSEFERLSRRSVRKRGKTAVREKSSFLKFCLSMIGFNVIKEPI